MCIASYTREPTKIFTTPDPQCEPASFPGILIKTGKEMEKKRGEEGGKKRKKEKKGNGDKNIYGTAKNFPIVSGQRASRTAAIQSFRRTCSLRMTTPCVVHTTDAANNMARRVRA